MRALSPSLPFFDHGAFMNLAHSDEARWWLDGAALRRVVGDLLAGEMAQLRPGMRPVPVPWPDRFDLRADLGADSLDLMGLATALETVLQLHRPANGEADAPLAGASFDAWVAAARAGLNAGGDALTFRTSGSSGTPKPCTHSLASLWQETGALAALLPGRRRIVQLVPSHHIYGFLFTVLLPRRLGLAARDVCDLRGLAPGALAAQLQPGDLVVGFPDVWRGFARCDAALAPADVIGVSSTAPCPDEVARGVLDAGLARLVQVYGSSETAGVGWRDRADADYTLFSYWSRGADEGRLDRTLPDAPPQPDGTLPDQPPQPDGTLPDRHPQPNGALADRQTQSYALQDRLAWSDAIHFRPAGRVDAAVQVGGVNVFAAYVADVLRLHPDVADVSVRLMRPDEGQRLKAFVVACTGVGLDQLRTELQAWLSERLSAAECPAVISFGPALPRGASGKLTDWIIDAWA
jgi:long-chain acyl-CoA synthetase